MHDAPQDSPFPALPRTWLATAVGAALASGAALAQDRSASEIVAAADIVVTGRALEQTLSSGKFTAPLLETPKSVTLISAAMIRETGSTSLVEALRTVPGITFNAGEGGQPAGDNLKIRGFDAGADVFIDGVRDAGSQTRDVFALEQIEVVKGPGSAYSGRGSTGGFVNLVAKKPRAEQFVVAHAGAGTDGYGRMALDANYRFGDSLGFRLNLLAQDFDQPGRDAVRGSHRGIAPSLSLGIGTPTRLDFDLYRYETDDLPDYSIPYARNAANDAPAGEPVGVDRTNFYGLVNRDFQRTSADVRTLALTHELASGLTLTNVTRYGRTTNDYIVTNPDDGRGNVPNGFVLRNPKSRNSATTTEANLTSVAGKANTGRVEHSYAFGIEAARERMANTPYVIETLYAGNAVTAPETSCSAPGALGAASRYNCTSLANPDPHDPWTGTITPSSTPTVAHTDTRAAYAFDTLDLGDRWSLNLGVRWDGYDTEQSGVSRGVRQDLANRTQFWNYQAGVVFKPTANGSVYLASGTSSRPSGSTLGDGTENLTTSNADLKPERDESYELGTKWALGERRLSLTAAVFRAETANARVSVASGLEQTIGAELVRGLEIGLGGAVTERLRLSASLALLDSEIVDDGPVETNEGNAFPNTPRASASLWTSYAVTPKLTVGGGASYVGKRFGNVANSVWIPEYWRYDAMAAFAVGAKIELQLNVQNLTDEVYFVRPYQNHYASLGAARSAVISATFDF